MYTYIGICIYIYIYIHTSGEPTELEALGELALLVELKRIEVGYI